MTASNAPALVAVARGSADPRTRPVLESLLHRLRRLRPGLRIELGLISGDGPPLAEVLHRQRGTPVLVPLLLTRGRHLKQSIPEAIAAAGRPALLAGSLGPHPLLAEALCGRLSEAGHQAPGAVVLAAAGSRDPESAAGTQHTADLLSARLGGIPVLPGYATAGPTVPEAVALLRERGHPRIAVASCFAAPGALAERCARAAPGAAAAPLGAHASLARLVLHRYDQALAAAAAPQPGTEPRPLAGVR